VEEEAMNANDPALDVCDSQLSVELSLLRRAFPISDCDTCIHYDEDYSQPCQVLFGSVDQSECPGLPELILDAQRAMEEEQEGCYGR
jgi:hypothetical protein